MTRFLIALIVVLYISPVEARTRAVLAHQDCNVLWPCVGVAPSARGERVVKAMGGFGSARKVYMPRPQRTDTQVVSHPSGCPSRAFCGCGAAVRVFGAPIRALWPAAAWFKFPRTAPAAGMVAVRRHHVFVLERDLGGGTWLAYDANSGGHTTRIHARSIAGYTIVNPRGGSA